MFDFGFVGLVVIIDDGSMNDGFVCVCHQKEKDLLFIMLLVRLFITYVRRIGTKFRRFSKFPACLLLTVTQRLSWLAGVDT